MSKLTPKASIRACCVQCLGLKQFNTEAVKDCQGHRATMGPCPFFPYRLGARASVKTFRKFCLQCMGGNPNLVRECETSSCSVHPYRFGVNPSLVGKRKAPKAGQEALKNYRQIGRDDTKSKPESTIGV
jgi:hypothetical protein